jgi:energy-coupling factor transporter transmembrane protein EcfT
MNNEYNNSKLYNLYLQLEPTITELEEERINSTDLKIARTITNLCSLSLKIMLWLSLIGLVLSLVFSFLGLKSPKIQLLTSSLIFLPLFLLILIDNINNFFKYKFIAKYRYNFKNKVIKKIIDLLNQNLEYIPDNYINKEEFINSQLFWEPKKNYHGDDLIQGNISGCPIQLSYISASWSDIDSSEQFLGLFAIIEFNKDISSPLGTNYRIGKHKVKFDNPEFNKIFNVFSNNITEAFHALPVNVLNRFVLLSKKYLEKSSIKNHKNLYSFLSLSPIEFSIIQNKVYIGIMKPEGFFEPPIDKSLFDYSIYEKYLTDLELILELAIGIVEDLKLA